MEGFIRFITDPQNLLSIGVGVLVFATVLTLLSLPWQCRPLLPPPLLLRCCSPLLQRPCLHLPRPG